MTETRTAGDAVVEFRRLVSYAGEGQDVMEMPVELMHRVLAALARVDSPDSREWTDVDDPTASVFAEQLFDDDVTPETVARMQALMTSHGIVQLTVQKGYRAPDTEPSADALWPRIDLCEHCGATIVPTCEDCGRVPTTGEMSE